MSGERNDEVTGRNTNFHHRNPSEQGSNSSTFIFFIGSVIGLLQVKDLFKTHPVNMWISVPALLIFCLSYAAKNKINPTEHGSKYSDQLINSFCVLSGALVTASLLSIFLPHRLRWLFFVIWALLATYIVARHFFNFNDRIYTLVLSIGVLMKKAILSVWNYISNRFTQPITVQRDHVLPI